MEAVEVTKPYQKDSEKIQFFYDLVNNDATIRHQTQEKLNNYLTNNINIDLKELIDINNYLYDAMWNADGYDIQREFSNYYGKLIFIIPKSNIILLIRSMFITTMNKWTIMDKHRINKYYAMIRQIIHHLFSYLSLNEYESPIYEDILAILKKTILLKEPLGVAYHIYDILLHELHLASPNITTDQYLKLLFCVIESCAFQDKVYIRKCKDQIFHPLIFDYLPKSDLNKPSSLKIVKNDSTSNNSDNNSNDNQNIADNNSGEPEDKSNNDTPSGNSGVNEVDNNKASTISQNKRLDTKKYKKNKKNKKERKIEPKKIKSFPHIDIRQLIQPIFNFASQKDCSSMFRKMLYLLTNTYKKFCQQNFDPKDIPSIVVEKPPPIENNDESYADNGGCIEEESEDEDYDEQENDGDDDDDDEEDEEDEEDDESPPDLSPDEDYNKQTKSMGKQKTKKVLRFNNKVTVRHIPSQKTKKSFSRIPEAGKRKKSFTKLPEVVRRKPKMVRN